MPDGMGMPAAARRRWSDEAKRRIVAESREPDARVGEVAARHGIAPSLLSVWRGLIDEAPMTPAALAGFIAVHTIEAAAPADVQRRHDAAADGVAVGWLRITLPDGTQLHISHSAQLPLLRGVLGVLRQ
jgi:transposase